MSWARIDDNFPQHPKVVQVGAVAAWLYVCGLCYCRKYHTGGFIPAGAVQSLGVSAAGRLIPHLIAVHLWERAEGGYRVHDYAAMYADEEDKQRRTETQEARRLNGQKGGLISGELRRSKAEAKSKQSASDAEANREAKLKHFASSKSEPLKDRNGSDRNGSDPSEGGAGETVAFYPEQALEILQAAYPQDRVTFGYRTETAWIQELNASGDAAAAYATMLAHLEQHKRSYEWRVKKMTPALSKWLSEGLWKRELDEDPPAAERPRGAVPQRRGCGHEPACLTHADHMRKSIDDAKAAEVTK